MTVPAVPTVLAIDIEPDGRARRPGGGVPLEGFRRTFAWLEELRPRLADATGRPVLVTWYLRMDPQVTWLTGCPDGLARAATAEIAALRAAGDTIGLHTHAARWVDDGWLIDHGDWAWLNHCLETSTAAYEATFGEPSREHRFGDRFSSPAVFDALARLGIGVDLSMEPGKPAGRTADLRDPATGSVPSYLDAPREARRHEGGPLWLLPLTSADPGPAMPLVRRVARRLRFLGQPLDRPLQLDRAWTRPSDVWDLAERRLGDMARPYLAFALRSDISLEPHFARTAATLEALLRHRLAPRLAFASGMGTVEALQGFPVPAVDPMATEPMAHEPGVAAERAASA